MIDWDDLRHFLAVARHGSVRAAAATLDVNHSTVLRRIGLLEDGLGVTLFEKLPSGYRLTNAGEDVLGFAVEMESASTRIETRVFGRDQSVRGLLRVTLAPTLAANLLMPDLAAFARKHPEIELEILSIDEPVNLTNRDADVAIRVVYDREKLPPNLHGIKGPELFGGVYVARDLLAALRSETSGGARWIIKNNIGLPDWAHGGELAISGASFRTTNADAQIAAVRAGLGVAALPCFVGDPDPGLVRVPGAPTKMHGTLWLLTQGETRRTKRVRLFAEHMATTLPRHADLLAGLKLQGENYAI